MATMASIQGLPISDLARQTVSNGKLPGADKKIAAGICGILIGGLGIHRFILGDTKGGLIRIGISFITCGAGGIIGFIEGILYLTKSDEEFVQTYLVEKKAWF